MLKRFGLTGIGGRVAAAELDGATSLLRQETEALDKEVGSFLRGVAAA